MILEFKEKSRKYIYSNGFKLNIKNVIDVTISDSGNHRIETEDGKKYIVTTGWVAVELDTEQWTF